MMRTAYMYQAKRMMRRHPRMTMMKNPRKQPKVVVLLPQLKRLRDILCRKRTIFPKLKLMMSECPLNKSIQIYTTIESSGLALGCW